MRASNASSITKKLNTSVETTIVAVATATTATTIQTADTATWLAVLGHGTTQTASVIVAHQKGRTHI